MLELLQSSMSFRGKPDKNSSSSSTFGHSKKSSMSSSFKKPSSASSSSSTSTTTTSGHFNVNSYASTTNLVSAKISTVNNVTNNISSNIIGGNITTINYENDEDGALRNAAIAAKIASLQTEVSIYI